MEEESLSKKEENEGPLDPDDPSLEEEYRALAEWLVDVYLWRKRHGEDNKQ